MLPWHSISHKDAPRWSFFGQLSFCYAMRSMCPHNRAARCMYFFQVQYGFSLPHGHSTEAFRGMVSAAAATMAVFLFKMFSFCLHSCIYSPQGLYKDLKSTKKCYSAAAVAASTTTNNNRRRRDRKR